MPNYHDPQNDVVRIVDGRRIPVQAYDLYGEIHKRSAKNRKLKKSQTNSTDLKLRFDGQTLKLIQYQGDIITEYSVPAVSGTPNEDGSFSYSKENQEITNYGPHPEGVYSVNPSDISFRSDNKLVNNLFGYIGRGKFPGGQASWGIGRLKIHMTSEQEKLLGRRGTFIHGGAVPGSRGCIDIVCNDKKFFDILKNLGAKKKNIPLVVDYSNTPDKVFFPQQECAGGKK